MAAAVLGGIDLPRHPRAAILTALTSTTRKAKARNIALVTRADAPAAEESVRELIGAEGDADYGHRPSGGVLLTCDDTAFWAGPQSR